MIADARPRQTLIALIGLSTGLLWTWSQPTVDAGWLGWVCLIPSFYLLLHHNLSGCDAWLLGASAGLTAGLGSRTGFLADLISLVSCMIYIQRV